MFMRFDNCLCPQGSVQMLRFLWSPEFLESVDRRSIHQLAATCKTDTKTTVVFRRPSDGKVSLFLEDSELGAIVISIRNLVPHLV